MPQKSIFPDVDIPNVSLISFLKKRSEEFADSVYLVDGTTHETFTFRDIWDQAGRVASGLAAHGLKRNDVVVGVLRNTPPFASSLLGTVQAGGIWSAANPAYTAYELEYHFKDCTASYVITLGDLLPAVRKAASQPGMKIKSIFVLHPESGSPGNKEVPFTTLLSFPVMKGHVESDPNNICFLPYSSGTTGVSKGVMLTHRNIIASMCMWDGGDPIMKAARSDVSAAVLPFYHIYGCASMLSSFCSGHKQVVLSKFDPRLYLSTIERYGVTVLYTVPPILLFLAKHAMVNEYNLKSVRLVTCGAAPVSKELVTEFLKRFQNVENVLQGFGMTECPLACLITAPSLMPVKIGSCGQPSPNYQAKIMSMDGSRELGRNEDGEIYVKGPSVMKGYLNKPEATKDTITADGWLRTGDIGHYDEDGLFYIVDRKKELIKVKGLQVPPAELEDILLSHPKVADAAVIGVPDERSGEVPKAFVVKKAAEGLSLADKELFDYVAARVARYKRLAVIEFVEQIPKSPSGKILRRVLRDQNQKSTSKL